MRSDSFEIIKKWLGRIHFRKKDSVEKQRKGIFPHFDCVNVFMLPLKILDKDLV